VIAHNTENVRGGDHRLRGALLVQLRLNALIEGIDPEYIILHTGALRARLIIYILRLVIILIDEWRLIRGPFDSTTAEANFTACVISTKA
jgi:hypothetical protein